MTVKELKEELIDVPDDAECLMGFLIYNHIKFIDMYKELTKVVCSNEYYHDDLPDLNDPKEAKYIVFSLE